MPITYVTPPPWLQSVAVAYLYDPNTHGFVVLVTPPGGVSLEVALSQTNLTGNGWTSDTFYPLDSDDPISPYTQRRNFYPSVLRPEWCSGTRIGADTPSHQYD